MLKVNLIFLGESYHHNHHKFPAALNLAMRPFEFDPIYHVIRFFDKVGIVRINKTKTFVADITPEENAQSA